MAEWSTSEPTDVELNPPEHKSGGRAAKDPRNTSRSLAFTDPWLRALKPSTPARDYRDTRTPGLLARALPSGRVQFGVRYRFQGKQRRMLLGEYPTTKLADAGKRARRAQNAVDDGRDPAAEQRAAKAKREDTVAVLGEDYLAKHARKFKRSAGEDERILYVEVLPKWREKPVRELTRRDVRALVERVAERAPIMANRVLAVIRKMLNFAVDHDWIDANPAARVKKPAPERSRDRVLRDEEIRRVWRVLSHLPGTSERPAPGRKRATGPEDDPLCPISAPMASLLKMRLMTAQRGGEIAHMRWADLALPGNDDEPQIGWWTIPGKHTKNGEPHRVPLTVETVALIKAQLPVDKADASEFVFTGRGGAMVLDRAKKAPAAIARVLAIDFRGHDLRRTAATNMAAAGVSRDHIARVLNHVEGGARATKVYDRYAYDWEKRAALDAWERRLKAILREKKDGNVVAFAKGHPND